MRTPETLGGVFGVRAVPLVAGRPQCYVRGRWMVGESAASARVARRSGLLSYSA